MTHSIRVERSCKSRWVRKGEKLVSSITTNRTAKERGKRRKMEKKTGKSQESMTGTLRSVVVLGKFVFLIVSLILYQFYCSCGDNCVNFESGSLEIQDPALVFVLQEMNYNEQDSRKVPKLLSRCLCFGNSWIIPWSSKWIHGLIAVWNDMIKRKKIEGQAIDAAFWRKISSTANKLRDKGNNERMHALNFVKMT